MLIAVATMCITMSSCSKDEKHPVRDMVLAHIKGAWRSTSENNVQNTLTFTDDQVTIQSGSFTPMKYNFEVNEAVSSETSYVIKILYLDATIKCTNISATQMDITATGKLAKQFDGTYHK